MNSPMERTLDKLRNEGYEAAVVQRSIPTRPHPISIDLFGVVDIEAIADDHTLYVQVCRDEDLSDHFAKCMNEPRTRRLLACPTRVFEIWAWGKVYNRWRERRYQARVSRGRVAFAEVAPAVSAERPLDAREA